MRQEYPRFIKLNTEVIIIGHEDAPSFQEFWLSETLPFVGMPDPEHWVLKLYGQEASLLKLGRLPAQMLIDTSCMLRYVHNGHSMTDILSANEIMKRIKS